MDHCTVIEHDEAKDAVPESVPPANQTETKQSKRGGRRPGAGRKPNLAKRLLKGFSLNAIEEGASQIDCRAVIEGLLKSKSERMRLETLAFLRDTILGRPAQQVSLSGSVMHWTPETFAHLSPEEWAIIEKLYQKPVAALPESTGSTNNQAGNQESRPAIDPEAVG